MDQIFTVLLKTSMAVGGIIACILDNLIPGTLEERGIKKWRNLATGQAVKNVASVHVYDLPFGITKSWKCSKFIPFLPYNDNSIEFEETVENGTNNLGANTDIEQETSPKTKSDDQYNCTTVL